MATTFGVDATSLQEPRGAGAQVIEGVRRAPSKYSLPTGLLDIGVQVVRDVHQREQKELREAVEQRDRQLIADYTRAQTRVADSNLPLQEKIARMNALDSQFQLAATEYGVLDEFKKARDLIKTGGITGEVVSEEEEAKKRYQENVKFLRGQNKYVPPNASPEYVDHQMAIHAQIEAEQLEYERSQRRLADAQSNVRFDQEQSERAIKKAATGALNKIGGKVFESYLAQAKAISDRVLSSDPDYGEEQGRADLIDLENRHIAIINSMSDDNPQLANVWRDQYQAIARANLDIITTRGEAGARDINRHTNMAAIVAAQDNPDLINLASIRPWIGDNNLTSHILSHEVATSVLLRTVGQDMSDTGAGSANFVANKDDKVVEDLSFAFIKEGLKSVRTGLGNDQAEAKAGYFQAANNVLVMIGERTSGNLSAEDFKETADFLASPEFAFFVKEGGLNAESAEIASRVFKQVYSSNIDGQVKKFMQSELPAKVDGRTLRYSDVISIEYRDGRVRLTPKQITPDDPQGNVQEIARNINSSVRLQERAINQNVRIGAHLEGTTDYRKFWEENKDILMPYVFKDPNTEIPDQEYNGQMYRYIGGPTNSRSSWELIDAE